MLSKQQIQRAVTRCIKQGNWIIRGDNDGISYGGFRWKPVGQWTEAPDWDPEPVCGGGLHGQDGKHGGYPPPGPRLVFCETKGMHIHIGYKVKVRMARVLLINTLPDNLKVDGNLNLQGTQITTLPDNLKVGGSLDLADTQITTLPDNLKVGGNLDLYETQITTLPDNLEVGGNIYR